MEKSTKITIGLFIAFVVFVILHNAIYGLFGTEEAIFFILALLSIAAFLISLIYSVIKFLVKNKKKRKSKENKIVFMYSFAITVMILGMLFNIFKIGRTNFSTFGSVGNWLIYIGFFGLIYSTIRSIWKTKKVVDERMHFVAQKALRISFLALVVVAFIIMIIDGITPIKMPYHLFMSYLVAGLLLVYYASYKILLKSY